MRVKMEVPSCCFLPCHQDPYLGHVDNGSAPISKRDVGSGTIGSFISNLRLPQVADSPQHICLFLISCFFLPNINTSALLDLPAPAYLHNRLVLLPPFLGARFRRFIPPCDRLGQSH